MKRCLILIVAIICLFFYSCMTTIPAVSLSAIEKTNKAIADTLVTMGYELSGKQNSQVNELSVSGTSFSKIAGYGTAMRNNYWNLQTLTFLDSNSNNISYTIKYQLTTNSKGEEILCGLEITNCSASRNYKTICDENGLVKGEIAKLINNPDTTIDVSDSEKSAFGVAFGAVGGILLLTTIILLMTL